MQRAGDHSDHDGRPNQNQREGLSAQAYFNFLFGFRSNKKGFFVLPFHDQVSVVPILVCVRPSVINKDF